MEFNWPTYARLLLGSGYAGPAPSRGGFEGGNDDDPRDPGGRTSRGILQREWNVFRQAHPGRPADVWQAPQTDVLSIYHNGQYWCGQHCPELPSGVDVNIADYGVNSGVGRSGRVLRHICGLPTTTYWIDDEVVAAVKKRDAEAVVEAICAERQAFLRSLRTFSVYGVGWTARVTKMRSVGRSLVGSAPISTTETPVVPSSGKATHPEPKTTKKVIQGGAAAGTGTAGFSLFDWVSAHPVTSAVVVMVVALGVYFLIKYVNDRHHAKNVTPMPGAPVVPELGRPT